MKLYEKIFSFFSILFILAGLLLVAVIDLIFKGDKKNG